MKHRIILIFALNFLMCQTNAQQIDFLVGASYNSFTIENINPSVFAKENESFNGFGLEFGLDSKIGKSIMSYEVGLGFNKLYAKNYSMSFVELPAILNLNVGKKVGITFGGGAKLRYLLKEPNYNIDYHHFERLLLSYTVNLGLSYKLKQLRFKLYPEFEFFQSRLYYTTFSPSPGYKGEDDYYLSVLSVKLRCLF